MSLSMHVLSRQDILAVSASDWLFPTVLRVAVSIETQLQGSGYSLASDLFDAIITEFQLVLQDGTLSRNIQKAASTSDVTVRRDGSTASQRQNRTTGDDSARSATDVRLTLTSGTSCGSGIVGGIHGWRDV